MQLQSWITGQTKEKTDRQTGKTCSDSTSKWNTSQCRQSLHFTVHFNMEYVKWRLLGLSFTSFMLHLTRYLYVRMCSCVGRTGPNYTGRSLTRSHCYFWNAPTISLDCLSSFVGDTDGLFPWLAGFREGLNSHILHYSAAMAAILNSNPDIASRPRHGICTWALKHRPTSDLQGRN